MELLESILMFIKEYVWGFLTAIEIEGTPILLAGLLWSIAIKIAIYDYKKMAKNKI